MSNIPGSPGTTPGQYNIVSPNTGTKNVDPAIGSTSGVNSYTPDALIIMQEASERASVDFTSAYGIRSAKRSLDFLAMEWTNLGLNLFTLEHRTLPLQVGVNQYNLATDVIDLAYPSLQTNQQGYTEELTMAREDFASYASIPNKSLQGRPSVVFVQRASKQPIAYFWLTPDNKTPYTFSYWCFRRPQNTGYGTNTLDLPFRALPAITAGLAWQLAVKKPTKDYVLIQMLRADYDKSLLDFQYGDSDPSPIMIAPYCGY